MSLKNQKKRLENFSKVRRIKTAQSSDRGTIFTEKNLSDGFVEFESLLEEALYSLLDHDPNCIDFESQPVEIPNEHNNGKPYVPDAWAKFRDGKQFIFDVKHQDYLDSLKNDPEKAKKWNLRIKCIKDFCKNGLHYEIITDNEIWNERFKNVQFFRKNKRIPELFSKIKPLIEEILNKKGGMPRIDLAIRISKSLGLDVKEVIPSIDHLIYSDFFSLDFQTKITDNTILYLKSDQDSEVPPLYLYFSKVKKSKKQQQSPIFTTNPKNPNYNTVSQQEFLALPEHIQREVLNRIELLKIFKRDDVSTEEIKKFALKNGISKSTLYYWKNNYEQDGWKGLIPEYQKRGRRKESTPVLKELIQTVIEEKYLTALQPSIAGCYRFLLIECKRLGIKPPSYATFRRRIQKIPQTDKTLKRRGKKMLRDHFRPLDGEYPFGKHPLDIIEFDHTILDVVLVDRIDRKAIGRPRLTIAVDVYSRMIYGYYLSFDSQNLLAIGMCFLTGILPKDNLTNRFETDNTWSIFGLPKRILLDNAKEFRSSGLFNFCKLYDMEMIFCPPKKPDTKPHVERVIKTINQAIRDDLIGGYVQPLDEKRKTGYDPEKNAEMTLDEFEKWLVNWIVDGYHQRIHTGIKEKENIEITPYERYEQGLADSNDLTVGLPTVPPDWEQLRFDVLPFKKRKLQRGGIKLFGLEYNAPIIAQLRAVQKSQKKECIVKYDPRDIREVYLWSESEKKYFNIPLKNVYLSSLKIDPENPSNYPLSLKEFETIKRSRTKKSPLLQHELAKTLEKRQKIVEESKEKTKRAKKRRRSKEERHVHKTKATSTAIRKRMKKTIEKEIEEGEKEEFIPIIIFSENSQEKEDAYIPEILPIHSQEEKKEEKYVPELLPVKFYDETFSENKEERYIPKILPTSFYDDEEDEEEEEK